MKIFHKPKKSLGQNFLVDKNIISKIVKIVEDLNIPVIDINKELFDKVKDPLTLFPFRSHGHYNVKGYELVTKVIYEKINKLEGY